MADTLKILDAREMLHFLLAPFPARQTLENNDSQLLVPSLQYMPDYTLRDLSHVILSSKRQTDWQLRSASDLEVCMHETHKTQKMQVNFLYHG